MDGLFIRLLNMSIAASWLILAVIVLRPLLKKAPKAVVCILWALVAVRLLVPFSLESALSLIPSAETVPQNIATVQTPAITSGIPALNSTVNPMLSLAPALGGNPVQAWTAIASYVWLAGLAAMGLYALVGYLRIRRRVAEAVPLRDNIWLCDRIDTPFLLGVLRPRIYLPSAMEEAEVHYVVAHENAHLVRRDHLWKPLGFALLAVYWFNPLCWLAYWLLCKDIELACDERVVRGWDARGKRAYSVALLSCSVPRRMIVACPLAFGEVGVKERIKGVLNYKKPAFWVIVAAVAACIAVAVCFLTNPVEKQNDTNPVSEEQKIMIEGKVYTQSGDAVSTLPEGSTELEALRGRLQEDPKTLGDSYVGIILDKAYAYCMIYQSGADENTVFLKTPEGEYLPFACPKKYKLTIQDVMTLAQEKGDRLTWSDFYSYECVETGSGLYICVYEIDERFSLWVGGQVQEKPAYIRLVSNINSDDYIDIRTGDIQAFLDADHPAFIDVSVGVTYASSACLYMNPLSSYYPVSGDSGCRYVAEENAFIIENRESGEQTVIPNVTWGWEDFPWTDEQWAALFGVGVGIDHISESYQIMQYQPLGQGYFLLKMDGALWLVELHDLTNMGEQLWSIYSLAPETTAPAGLSALDAAIAAEILARHAAQLPGDSIACESHVILATEESDATPVTDERKYVSTVTAYVVSLYQQFQNVGGVLQAGYSAHMALVVSLEKKQDGTYALFDYWEPRDDSWYTDDIENKFPASIADDAINKEAYLLALKQDCYAQAAAQFKMNTDAAIVPLLDTITSSPAASSNPGDYIKAHPDEYRELTYYGDATLRYIFAQFIKGGQTDLRGQIMRQIMDDLIGGEALKLDAENGQEYFDAWRMNAEKAYVANGTEFMLEQMPKAWRMMQLTGLTLLSQ